MAISKNWLNMVRRKFRRSSDTGTILPNTKTSPSPISSSEETAIVREETASFKEDIAASTTPSSSQKKDLTKEEIAAIKIQAFFRGYLARRALRAPTKSVVTSARNKRTGKSQNCFRIVQRKSRKSSHTNNTPNSSVEESIVREETTESEDTSFAASSTSSSQKTDTTKEVITEVRQTFGASESMATSSKKKRMGMSQNCFSMVQRRFRSSHRDIISANNDTGSSSDSTKEATVKEETINVKDPNGATSSTPSRKKDLTQEDVAAIKIQAIFRGHRARRAFRTVSSPRKKENTRKTMRMSQNLFNRVRRKFRKTSRDIILSHTNTCARSSTDEAIATEETEIFENACGAASSTPSSKKKDLTKEDIAAIKIQAFFRGHLARRAFRALGSLVKLQAVVRGAGVRRQARIALHCMHALARLQVRVRARQLLNSEELS